MKININLRIGTQDTAAYATSHKEEQIGPEAMSDIRQKTPGDVVNHPIKDDSSNNKLFKLKKNTKMLVDRFLILEFWDLTRDKANFGYYGLVLRREDGGMDDIYFCRLYESELPSVVLEEGDIVTATLDQEEEQLGEYNYEDNTVVHIKLINKLKWMKLK